MEKGAEFTGRALPMQPKLCLTPKIPRFYTTEGLTSPGGRLFLTPLLPLPGSSVVEQVTVNHLVVGSIPTRAAILLAGKE
jgi:hypothetical protein